MLPLSERVRLVLGDQEITTFQSYEISQRFLQIPAAFSCRVGSGTTAKALIAAVPPGTPYQLFIGETLQHSGRTDDYSSDDASGATIISVRGRDALSPIHDDHVTAERSFTNASFKDLVVACIEGAGIKGYSLVFSDEVNRKAICNIPANQSLKSGAITLDGIKFTAATSANVVPGISFQHPPPRSALHFDISVSDFTPEQTATAAAATPPKPKALHAKIGQTWYQFLEKELRRAGLFLFAGADENVFILTSPTAHQVPIYELYRQRGSTRNAVNILSHHHRNETAQRYSHYIVYGRGGGGKDGRTKVKGVVVDHEMLALGIERHWAHADSHAKNTAQAEFLARRKCGEDRRRGWTLSYSVKGHLAPSLVAPGRKHVWGVNTVARVRDDELGIANDLWIEGVTFHQGEHGETTDITLMRPEDLVFGEVDGEST